MLELSTIRPYNIDKANKIETHFIDYSNLSTCLNEGNMHLSSIYGSNYN